MNMNASNFIVSHSVVARGLCSVVVAASGKFTAMNDHISH